MQVKIVNKSKHPLPEYATALSAGMDLRADIDGPVTLKPLQRALIPTGIHIPVSYTHLDVYKRQDPDGRIAAGSFRHRTGNRNRLLREDRCAEQQKEKSEVSF